ncbi:hypothetical protein PENSPDRAFT_599378 [Peniophora sp. CONT]|nr:hypothetical protein PENSPDRAFT_599378 [Peniophora sp. CONT]
MPSLQQLTSLARGTQRSVCFNWQSPTTHLHQYATRRLSRQSQVTTIQVRRLRPSWQHSYSSSVRPLSTSTRLQAMAALDTNSYRAPSSFADVEPVTKKPNGGPTATTQNVTLPHIPDLFRPDFLDILLPVTGAPSPAATASSSSTLDNATFTNPLMEALKASTNHTQTWNGADAFQSTLSATLDAFQAMGPGSVGAVIEDNLEAAWKEDPQLALRIIWNVRSIHDGKGDKEVFYRAFGWLYKNHPRTAIQNLPLLVAPACSRGKSEEANMPHGYWKDLANILALAARGELSPHQDPFWFLHSPRHDWREQKSARSRGWVSLPKDKAKRAEALDVRQRDLATKLETDRTFRALYIMVAHLFAGQLVKDLSVLDKMQALEPGSEEYRALSFQLSLAAKWAPSPGNSHDRNTNLTSAIVLLLHMAGVSTCISKPISVDAPVSAEDMHILRSFYQRWVLTPLRKTLVLPEPLMSARRWGDVAYNRVASRSMAANSKHFTAHDPDRFTAYLTQVESGKSKISGATLMPHELLAKALAYNSNHQLPRPFVDIMLRVADAQWGVLIDRLREAGALDNTLAVCDVSGSMGSLWYSGRGTVEPIFPAVALSLVLAQLARPHFRGGFITFSSEPEFVQVNVERDGLVKTAQNMVGRPWEMNTNLQAVFVDLLLPLAIKNKVAREDMVKRLVIFSDMQFDQAAGGGTNHEAIARAYAEAGYDMPQIVYWNLAAHSAGRLEALPVTAEMEGVALMNGFSPAMLKVFMGEAEELEDAEWGMVTKDGGPEKKKVDAFDPVSVMRKALLKKSFDALVVVD